MTTWRWPRPADRPSLKTQRGRGGTRPRYQNQTHQKEAGEIGDSAPLILLLANDEVAIW